MDPSKGALKVISRYTTCPFGIIVAGNSYQVVLFVLVLVLSETVLVLEEKYWDFVDKRAKYWGSSFPERVSDLNRFRRFRVRVRVPRR